MKIHLILLPLLAFASAVSADGYRFAIERAESNAYLAESQVAFIGRAEILGMRYLGEDNRVLSPEEVAAWRPAFTDPLYYSMESPIRRIEFRLKVIPKRLLKGAAPSSGFYEFTYTNSLIVMFASQPRTLHRGRDFVFYVRKADGNRILELDYGEPAAIDQNAEQDGAGQPATAPESKPEGKENPKPKSEVRPQ